MLPVVASLLESLVDYAGLFPPAQCSMPDAVRNHDEYLAAAHRAALGRFVVPLARFREFAEAYAQLVRPSPGWQLSVLATADAATDTAAIQSFNFQHPATPIAAIETKASTAAEVLQAVGSLPATLEVWVEIPAASPDLNSLLAALKSTGRGAKVRTGGVTPEAFPRDEDVVRFIRGCHEFGVAFKATAGLHHPLAGDYRLTYAATSPHGRMFGFLNVFLAAALTRQGGADHEVLALLRETDPHAFTLAPDAIHWNGHPLTTAALQDARKNFCRSFGSCSFTEPLEGLHALRWL